MTQRAPGENAGNPLRDLPSVDAVMRRMPAAMERWGRRQLASTVRMELDAMRAGLRRGASQDCRDDALVRRIEDRLRESDRPSLQSVINLSGTVLHTNLGRAVLPQSAQQAVQRCAAAPCNLEYELDEGRRGDRDSHVESLVCELTGAEAATVVNNNAAAVLLVLNTLALDREVPVSRGELVEIGGSFRVPEVMERAGVRLVEVGATNRTHLSDYERALNDATALLMKVHTSNYRIEGFTDSVAEADLAELAHARALPLVVDLGSGNLVDFARFGLPDEPTVAGYFDKGVDIVTFSGDKLLGGPQCGIVAGKADALQRIRANPLRRALRPDKMTLAALAEVLRLYRDPDTLAQKLPTLRFLTRALDDIERQAQRLQPLLAAALRDNYEVSCVPCRSQIGSGALPVDSLASHALSIRAGNGADAALRRLAQGLRRLEYPVIGRLHDGALLLDLRCLDCEAEFVSQLNQLPELLT